MKNRLPEEIVWENLLLNLQNSMTMYCLARSGQEKISSL